MILSLNLSLELPDRSYSISDTQDCFEYIIKKYETLTYKPPVQKYVSWIQNRVLRARLNLCIILRSSHSTIWNALKAMIK